MGKRRVHMLTKSMHRMLTVALLIVTQQWKQPTCPPAVERISKLWYIQTLDYHTTMRMNELQFNAKEQINQAPARWLSWLEHCPIDQKSAGSIPDQGTYLGCSFAPWWVCMQEATDQ